jgi:peptide/nickel transport system substrate-binding protein
MQRTVQHPERDSTSKAVSRRDFLHAAGVGVIAVASGAALAACSSTSPTPTTSVPTSKPKKGGTLRAALTGGTSADTLNANAGDQTVDNCRANQLFDPMVWLNPDCQLENVLVQEFIPNANATKWTMRLRPDVTFHNGKPLTADDLIYTLQQIANPSNPLNGASTLKPCDMASMKKVDNLTVELPCRTPYATFPEAVAAFWSYFNILPVGFNPAHPIGTGPFKFKSFTPGVTSTFVRNENYWQHPYPYFDEVIIDDYPDETSQINALLSGATDVVNNLSADSVAALSSASGARLLYSAGGGIIPFTMRVDVAPFNDVRVRQAMRLIVGRPAMLNNVFGGHGLIGNDVSSIYDPEYDHAIPQREQDIDQARSLLKAAGHEGLTVELVTGNIAQGAVSLATVFQQQAKAAGVTVNLRELTVTEFYGPEYLSWAFAMDYWYYNPYLSQVAQSLLSIAPYNECHWDNPRYDALYNEAIATLDSHKRAEIAHEMQIIDYTSGGYIVPNFPPVIDGYASNIHGVVQSRYGMSLGNFSFDKMWMT